MRPLWRTTLRDLAYWNGQLSCAGSATGETFHVAERKGEIVAYARHADLGAPILMEYAHAPGAEEALAWLIAEFCEVDRALLLRLPPGLPLEHALLRHIARADPVDDPTFMWRVLDRERLAQLSGLAPDASEREILRELIETPPVHYWVSDRF